MMTHALMTKDNDDSAPPAPDDDALFRGELRFRGIVESAPDAMVISDASGSILLVNAETERLFGYARAELIGQSVEILIPLRFRGRHPEHRGRYTARPRTRTMGQGIELSGLRKDGSEFPVEIGLSPIETEDGTLFSSAIRDVSARRQAEEKSRADEARHRMAIEVAGIGTWRRNLIDDEFSWSDGFVALFGLPADAVVTPAQIVEYVHPDDRKVLEDRTRTALEQNVPYAVEYRVKWPDGSIHWLATQGRLERNATGAPAAMEGIVVDITARKRAEEVLAHQVELERRAAELKRSNDELQQFAYIAAHDLQEPLRMVASYTQLLSQRYSGQLDADADDFIGYAVDGAHRMQLLIGDLLTYCRVGTTETAVGDISSTEALAEAAQNLEGAILEAGASVTFDELPVVVADRAQLVQVFQNLVGNAIKYRGVAAPCVHVSVVHTPNVEWVFAIKDNGIGIEPQYFDKIFVMFQRLHRREDYAGTGMGLSLCKKIVERLGGRLWVESEYGSGSTFFLALPEGKAHG